MTDEPPFVSEYYRRCDDPECPVAYAYRDPYPAAEHYHYAGVRVVADRLAGQLSGP